MEKLLIALYKTNCYRYKNPAFGYNMTDGGNGTVGRVCSDDTKRKISNANRNPSSETREKMRNARIGTHASEEAKKKMSEQKRGELNSFYGKSHTDEAKNKIKEARKHQKITDKQLECLALGRGTKCWTDETYKKLSERHRGESSSSAKLTEENVIDILSMINDGYTYSHIRNKYHISDAQISRIKNKQRWGYLYDKFPYLYDFPNNKKQRNE